LIRIKVFLERNCCLKGLESFGHAGLALKGSDILCAAVTILLRTVGKVLTHRKGMVVFRDVAKPGVFSILVQKYEPENLSWLLGVTDTLVGGLEDLVEEYPENLKLEIIR